MLPAARGRRLGVALGGGGARGLAHLGVLQALDEAGIHIHALAGISAGALMAAGHALGGPNAELDAVLRDPATLRALYRDRVRLAPSNPIGGLLARLAGETRIEDLALPLAVCATDVWTREHLVLRSGPLLPALQASIAIPFVSRPVRVNGRYLADSGRDGYVMREALRAMGAEVILEVLLYPPDKLELPPRAAVIAAPLLRRLERPPAGAPRGLDVLRFAIDLAVRAKPAVPAADVLITPAMPAAPTFARDGLRRTRSAGYTSMRAALPRVRALLSGGAEEEDTTMFAAAGGV